MKDNAMPNLILDQHSTHPTEGTRLSWPWLQTKMPYPQMATHLSNNIDLELEYTFVKPMKHKFQQYIKPTEIFSTFHTQVEYISLN